AEVEANCPEVLTLLLPENPEDIPKFLKHCWAFDHLRVTSEDRKRADMYQASKAREQALARAGNLADFIAGLDLSVAIENMVPQQLPRVSQLTQRTNQFNCTTV